MHVDEARDHGRPGRVEDAVHPSDVAVSEAGDASVAHDHGPLLDDLAALQGDEPRSGESDASPGAGSRALQPHVSRLQLAVRRIPAEVEPVAIANPKGGGVDPARGKAAVGCEPPAGETLGLVVEERRLAIRPGLREGMDEYLVPLFPGEPAAIGRRGDLVGVAEGRMHPPIAAIAVDRHQVGEEPALLFTVLGEVDPSLGAERGADDLAPVAVGLVDEPRPADFG